MKNWTLGCLLAAFALVVLVGCGGNGFTPNPFAGNYSGTYAGDDTGTWTAVISEDGDVAATFDGNTAGQFVGDGQVAHSGNVTLTAGQGSGAGWTATWIGRFETVNGVTTGSGTWSSTSGDEGTWEGTRN
jgi:major membrane immunogen (membrane-anchored lipoprotein)